MAHEKLLRVPAQREFHPTVQEVRRHLSIQPCSSPPFDAICDVENCAEKMKLGKGSMLAGGLKKKSSTRSINNGGGPRRPTEYCHASFGGPEVRLCPIQLTFHIFLPKMKQKRKFIQIFT